MPERSAKARDLVAAIEYSLTRLDSADDYSESRKVAESALAEAYGEGYTAAIAAVREQSEGLENLMAAIPGAMKNLITFGDSVDVIARACAAVSAIASSVDEAGGVAGGVEPVDLPAQPAADDPPSR